MIIEAIIATCVLINIALILRTLAQINPEMKNSFIEKRLKDQKTELLLLGEIHTYSKKASIYAEKQILSYEILVHEGVNYKESNSTASKILRLSLLVFTKSIGKITSQILRKDYPHFIDIAHKHNIKVLGLEQEGKSLSLFESLCLFLGIMSIIILFLLLISKNLFTMPEIDIALENRYTRLAFILPSTLSMINFNTVAQWKRDKLMAERIVAIIHDNPNKKILVGMGAFHIKGVLKHLKKTMPTLEEIGKQSGLENLFRPLFYLYPPCFSLPSPYHQRNRFSYFLSSFLTFLFPCA